MQINVLNTKPGVETDASVFFMDYTNPVFPENISSEQRFFIERQISLDRSLILVNNVKTSFWIVQIKDQFNLEGYRKLGADLSKQSQNEKTALLTVDGSSINVAALLAFTEGFALAGYRFVKYFKADQRVKKLFTVTQIDLYHPKLTEAEAENQNHLIKSVFWVRDMVNEPVSVLDANRLAKEVTLRGQASDFKVEVLDKKQIETLKMGGLLAVNRGSIDPPTFTICEWKPENAVNKKPFVLVGKGVVYDTGGLSLKSTANSMDIMKCDMAGAAAVAGTINYLALSKTPVWVIGLLPATDNRPDGNAYTPGDVITMYNGLHVEIMNTDAEGRLIMADALSYGDKYEPELVIDMATLTGSAHLALGEAASVFMGNAPDTYFEQMIQAGTNTHERLVRFPFWDDYKESLKSPIADLKNLGKREAGAISAGKFLEHFTQSPYIHIDIAGPAFLSSDDSYRLTGGTGVGVRLLAEFFKIISNTRQKN
jgi:leucyl aminopeptidase